MLFAAGLLNGACPELWNDTHADVVRGIHRGYFEAGSDHRRDQHVRRHAAQAERVRDRRPHPRAQRQGRAPGAGAGAPAARLRGGIDRADEPPAGSSTSRSATRTDEEYVETFREQAEALAEGGVDLFAVETMMFPQEAVAAVRACKAVADLPVMATMFFQYEELHDRDRTMWGESPAEVAKNLLAAGADVVGMNCGRGPDRAIVIIREMRAVTDAPLVAYPNAGLPITTGDNVTYELGPEAMAREYPALLDAGANIVGRCCGSNARAHPPDRRGRPGPPPLAAPTLADPVDWPAFDLALRARRRPILERFTEFLRVDTVSQQPERVRAGAGWLADAMHARGFDARVLETGGNPVVLGTRLVPGATRTLLLYCHFDTKPAQAQAGSSPRRSSRSSGRVSPRTAFGSSRPSEVARRGAAGPPPLRARRVRRQGPDLGAPRGARPDGRPRHLAAGQPEADPRGGGGDRKPGVRRLRRGPSRPARGGPRPGDRPAQGRERAAHQSVLGARGISALTLELEARDATFTRGTSAYRTRRGS